MALRDGFVVFLLGIGLCMIMMCVESSEAADQYRLLADLFNMYNYQILVSPEKPVNVTFKLDLISIDELDEKLEVLHISTIATTKWRDRQLMWNPEDYGGLKLIRVPVNKLWTPDVGPLARVLEDEYIKVMIDNNGHILYTHMMRIASSCRLLLANYPFDSQTCKFKVGSWSYDLSEIDVELGDNSTGISLNHFEANSLWTVESAWANKVVQQGDPNSSLMFHINMKRQLSGEYTVRVIAPTVVTSLLIPFCFLIPPTSSDRLIVCSILLLSVLVQLFYFNLSVPMNGSGTPFLGRFLCLSVFLAFFAFIVSVLSRNLSYYGKGRDNGVITPTQARMRTARIIDVICLIVFTIIFAIAGASYSTSIWHRWSTKNSLTFKLFDS